MTVNTDGILQTRIEELRARVEELEAMYEKSNAALSVQVKRACQADTRIEELEAMPME